jgi:hypothetical protein
VRFAVLAVVVASGCQQDIAAVDGAFYDWSGRRMHCAVDIDTSTYESRSSIDSALDRARDRGEVAELYAHHPGVTVPADDIEYVLAGARDRGLAFVTYHDMADPATPPAAGLALSFDDTFADAWFAQRALFATYGARVTFFVSRYYTLSADERAELQQLAADGHDVEAHSVEHLRGPDVVARRGLTAYLHEEVSPSISVLREDGYDVVAFAYPYGARTRETDHVIFDHVRLIRSVAFTWPEATSRCPL